MNRLERVMVTGAGGFVGRALCNELVRRERGLQPIVRRPIIGLEAIVLPDATPATDWRSALEGCDAVVHLLGRAHVLDERESDPLSVFRRVNVGVTVNLARQARELGVRRFVFVSSIGVNGNETFERPFCAPDPPAPKMPYAVSKLEAERELNSMAADGRMEVVIVRPPLVYGPGAPGNFATLINWVRREVPLPLGAVNNLRSFIAIDNLVDFIDRCLEHPSAANETFLVSDGEDLSTTQLLRRLAAACSVRSRLLPVPAGFLRALARVAGRADLGQRLFGSLQVDIRPTQSCLGWQPRVSVDEGLFKAAGRKSL